MICGINSRSSFDEDDLLFIPFLWKFSNLVFIECRSIQSLPSLCTVNIRFPGIWDEQKGDRMLLLKERMVRVVLILLSALTPGKVALRPVPVVKSRFSVRSRR